MTLDLATMHGNIVAICPDDTSTTGTSSYGESTEYGAPRDAPTAPDTYGWLGAKRRSTNDLAGLTRMGVRRYNPAIGRFLSVDPVPGGNDNPYIYVTNPTPTCSTSTDRLGSALSAARLPTLPGCGNGRHLDCCKQVCEQGNAGRQKPLEGDTSGAALHFSRGQVHAQRCAHVGLSAVALELVEIQSKTIAGGVLACWGQHA